MSVRRAIMKAKKGKPVRNQSNKRQPPMKIPLPFDKAMKGLLGLSPEDAKEVRESERSRARK
jgi:hypothetical protein